MNFRVNRVERHAKRIVPFIIIIFIIYTMQWVSNFLSYDLRGPSKIFVDVFKQIGVEEEFARMIICYAVQICCTFIIITLLIRRPLSKIGFNFDNIKLSLKYIVIFIIVYPIILLLVVYMYKIIGINAVPSDLQCKDNIYIFKSFVTYGLLPGLGEEPFFRVFIIQYLLIHVFKNANISSKKIQYRLSVISGFFFMIGHIFISWYPFFIKYNLVTLIAGFGLGTLYTLIYLRTKSIFAPIVFHNYTDLIARVIGLL